MRKLLFIWLVGVLVSLFESCSEPRQVKYVFYFIGDGMGVNQVNGTEMFLAELDSVIGVKGLNFASFPVRNYATTYSSYNGVTCSAAAGTALATGEKTKNGTIGMDKEQKEPLYSVAVRAKEAGRKVGIITSVGMNHATPAAFYGHQPRRTMYFELGKDAIKAGFDLYGGGGIIQSVSPKDSTNLFDLLHESGYLVVRGNEMFREKMVELSKLVVIQGGLQTTLPYAIDREEDDFTLSQMTEGAIDFLSRGKQGFFLMVEGGLIDYACHVNDAATAFREVEDFADAVQKAYEFYLKHPDETLIVVTADHETGGIVLGTGSYQLNLRVLENQRVSLEKLTREIRELRDMKSNQVAWEDVQELLAKNLGFWNTVNLSTEDEQALKNCYRETFSGKTVEMVKNLYSENEPIAQLSINILNRLAKISWASGGHSAGVVPVYAIGVGAEWFNGRLDNTDIPRIIEALAKYE